mgnify:CR=1 FL=1
MNELHYLPWLNSQPSGFPTNLNNTASMLLRTLPKIPSLHSLPNLSPLLTNTRLKKYHTSKHPSQQDPPNPNNPNLQTPGGSNPNPSEPNPSYYDEFDASTKKYSDTEDLLGGKKNL